MLVNFHICMDIRSGVREARGYTYAVCSMPVASIRLILG